ncbi:hypothetical protein [Deminuibacter soli]|uniref:hypothetical protein n=1 Tax=Deminuibacter soli TaxID=2291815 RepID=UPI001B87FD5F|nr:hypothetical protein [Deminuibacter soli]
MGMRMALLLILGLVGFAVPLTAQFTYTIKADSVKITNENCSAELIIENSTKNVEGFLFNYGKGRTRFRDAGELYQPKEDQRLSTNNSPSFYTETLTSGVLHFVNASNDILADGSDPGMSYFNYVKFRAQNNRGAGLQLVPAVNGIQLPYAFDFNATTDGANSLKIIGDGGNGYHVISSCGSPSGGAWGLAIQMSSNGVPMDRGADVIRINTDKSLYLPQIGAGYLVADASGRISTVSSLQKTNASLVSAPMVTSGSYSPTILSGSNIASSSVLEATYTQIGNMVHVALRVNIAVTSTNAQTVFAFSLPTTPIAGSGTGVITGDPSVSLSGGMVVASDGSAAQAMFTANNTTAKTFCILFDYAM